jgi:hypothetical protein
MKLVPQDFRGALRIAATLVLLKCPQRCVKRLEEKGFPSTVASDDEIYVGEFIPINLDQRPEVL